MGTPEGSRCSMDTAHLMGDPPKDMCLAMVDIDCEMHLRPDVTSAVARLPEVITVEEAASNRDLTLTVITQDLGAVQHTGVAETQGDQRAHQVPHSPLHSDSHQRICVAAQRPHQGRAAGTQGARRT